LAQLKTHGLTASGVRKRIASGRLFRVHHRVYSLVPPALLSLRGRYMAAVLACGEDAVLSHRSAAHLHEIRATSRAKIDVTVPGRSRPKVEGVDVHRSITLTPADVTTVDGIPCTTVARTVHDLAAVVNPRATERAIEQAEIREILDLRKLQDVLARNARTRGARRLRRIFAERFATAPTESELEEQLLALCRGARLPLPERQVYIDPGDGEPPVRVDFCWRAQKLVVETDGGRYHRTPRAFESDRRRDQRLTLAGWRVLRITWRQLRDEPQRIAAMIAQALRPQ
jgi:very-short-patch-repair endonuclease